MAYKKHLAAMDPMDREVERIAGQKSELEEESPGLGANIFELPDDYKKWSKKKQLEFQRKKMIKL